MKWKALDEVWQIIKIYVAGDISEIMRGRKRDPNGGRS